MPIVFDRGRQLAGGGTDCGCADVAGGDACCGELGELAAAPGRRGHALRSLGRAHRAGGVHEQLGRRRRAAGNLGDLDASAFVIDRTDIDAEDNAFDGRLNAWLLDYATVAAALPPSFVQMADDFVARWRKFHADWYLVGKTRATSIIGFEAEFNRLRDQFLSYGHTTAIAPVTVTADGKTIRADELPAAQASWFDNVRTIAIWGGVIVGGAAALKISSDLGLFKKLGHLIPGEPSA
jgi:hypothetical protein